MESCSLAKAMQHFLTSGMVGFSDVDGLVRQGFLSLACKGVEDLDSLEA